MRLRKNRPTDALTRIMGRLDELEEENEKLRAAKRIRREVGMGKPTYEELAAQVEAFKLIVVVHERELPHLVNKSKEDQFYLPLSIAMNAIVDAQELREKEILKIKAEAGRTGFIAGANAMLSHGMADVVNAEADEYAERVKAGEK